MTSEEATAATKAMKAPKLAFSKTTKATKAMKAPKLAFSKKKEKAMMKSFQKSIKAPKKSTKKKTKATAIDTVESLKDFLAGTTSTPGSASGSGESTKQQKTTGKTTKKSAALVRKRPSAAMEETVPEGTRDRMKAYYFKEALKHDTLEPELRQLWDRVKGDRRRETMVINGVMAKTSSGKFKASKDSPQFQEISSKVNMNFWRDENKGIPESLAIVKFKGEENLKRAIARGDVQETVDSGQKFYSWRTIVTGKGGRSETSHNISKKGLIDDATYNKLSGLLSQIGWQFNYTSKQQQATLEGEPLPAEALQKLEMAQTALAKVSKTSIATMQSLKPLQQTELVKQAHSKLSENLKRIRVAENTLEGMAIMGVSPEGKQVTCQEVLLALGDAAKLLEESFSHVKVCGGLLRGSK